MSACVHCLQLLLLLLLHIFFFAEVKAARGHFFRQQLKPMGPDGPLNKTATTSSKRWGEVRKSVNKQTLQAVETPPSDRPYSVIRPQLKQIAG